MREVRCQISCPRRCVTFLTPSIYLHNEGRSSSPYSRQVSVVSWPRAGEVAQVAYRSATSAIRISAISFQQYIGRAGIEDTAKCSCAIWWMCGCVVGTAVVPKVGCCSNRKGVKFETVCKAQKVQEYL